jgi:putative ABC transport system permease protein
MGAKAGNIFLILSTDFLKVVFIACVISAPIAWLLLSKWLQSFLYRANLSLWIFLLATCSAMLISLLTISFQVARAALQNPIKILRSE